MTQKPPNPWNYLPAFPWEGPPIPRILLSKGAPIIEPKAPDAPDQADTPKRRESSSGCEYGLSCIRDHLLRAHLYLAEAIRFSADGTIGPAAVQKVRQARENLLCEDDFQAAMDAPMTTKMEVLKLLASTRAAWKEMDRTGVDHGEGTVADLIRLEQAMKVLYDRAYAIDFQFRRGRNERGPVVPRAKSPQGGVAGTQPPASGEDSQARSPGGEESEEGSETDDTFGA